MVTYENSFQNIKKKRYAIAYTVTDENFNKLLIEKKLNIRKSITGAVNTFTDCTRYFEK
jgi:hypothetical protein